MAYPAWLVSFAPGVAASAVPTAAQWVDITADVLTLQTNAAVSTEFSVASAGECNLTLDNSSGRYDPDNAAGPYAGQLLPLTWFRVRAGAAVVDTDVFYGQVSIEGWRLRASQFLGQMVVELDVLDMFEQLANTDLPSSVYEAEVRADNPLAWYRLGESSGAVANDSSGNGRHGTYEGGATFNSRSSLIANDPDNAIGFDGVNDLVRIDAAGISGAAWTVEAWFSHGTVDANDRVIWEQKGTGGYATALGLSGTSGAAGTLFAQQVASPTTGAVLTGTRRLDDGRPHHVVLSRDPGAPLTMSMWVDGTLETSGSGFNPLPAPSSATIGHGDANNSVVVIAGTGLFAGTLDEVAIYSSTMTPARIAAHHAAGTTPWKSDLSGARVTKLLDAVAFPATLRNIGAGRSTLQSATLGTDALSALREVARAERGELYIDHADGGKVRFRGRHERWTATASITSQVTFGDGGGTEIEPESIDIGDDRIVNRASVQRKNGSTVTVSDAASETTYQRRSFSATGLLLENDSEVQGRAELVVAEKKDRHRYVRSVTVTPTDSTDPAWNHVFARRIGDRVTVRWRPPYGGTYSFPSIIEGISHSYDAGRRALRTTFHLSPVPYGSTGTPYIVVGTSLVGSNDRIGY